MDLYFRLQELPAIAQYQQGLPADFIVDGIQYPPFVLSALVCAACIAGAIILVNSKTSGPGTARLTWLGSAWLLASIFLILDLMIDTFEVKWPVIILFAYVGVRYWKGARRNSLGLVLAPAVTLVAVLDGLNHAGGQDCAQTGLDACPAKAVSDLYLVIILLALTYLTIIGWLDLRADKNSSR